MDDHIPFVTDGPSRRRRPWTVFVTAAGMAALLAVGSFAISALVGGGSDSPEGAVRQLADAVSHEDALAAADVLAPEEVRSLHGTVYAAIHKAAELHAVDATAAPLRGVDFSVDGLRLSSERLGDNVVKVTLQQGQLSARTERRLLSALRRRSCRTVTECEPSTSRASLTTIRRSSSLFAATASGT